MTFGVYLIHNHPLVSSYLMKEMFNEYATFKWIVEILIIFGTTIVINFICYIIDFIRLELFKMLHIRQSLDLFEERIKVRILN